MNVGITLTYWSKCICSLILQGTSCTYVRTASGTLSICMLPLCTAQHHYCSPLILLWVCVCVSTLVWLHIVVSLRLIYIYCVLPSMVTGQYQCHARSCTRWSHWGHQVLVALLWSKGTWEGWHCLHYASLGSPGGPLSPSTVPDRSIDDGPTGQGQGVCMGCKVYTRSAYILHMCTCVSLCSETCDKEVSPGHIYVMC